MPSTASKQPSGAASTPVTRTSSRCGTGLVAASVTTAVVAGGPTTTTSSSPPSTDAYTSLHAYAAALHPCGLACCPVDRITRTEFDPRSTVRRPLRALGWDLSCGRSRAIGLGDGLRTELLLKGGWLSAQ